MFLYAHSNVHKIGLIADIKYSSSGDADGAHAECYDVYPEWQMVIDFISLDEKEVLRAIDEINAIDWGKGIDSVWDVDDDVYWGTWRTALNGIPAFSFDYCRVYKEYEDSLWHDEELTRIADAIVVFREFYDSYEKHPELFSVFGESILDELFSVYSKKISEIAHPIFLTDELEIDFTKSSTLFDAPFWWYAIDNTDYFNHLDKTKNIARDIINYRIALANRYADALHAYSFFDPLACLIQSAKNLVRAKVNVKKCNNCGLYFIPKNRSDTLYCDRQAPQDETKICKEYGARQAWGKTLKENEAAGLYRKIYMAKQMLVRRNSDITAYNDSFELFKSEAKKWKADVRNGIKSESEYIEWLKSVKEKKVITDAT